MSGRPKKLLLSGASGFIGANVLKYLLAHTDNEFTCLASWRHKGDPFRLADLNRTYAARVDVVTHDLTGPLPEMGQFDYILNLASESHVDRSIQDPVPFIENNIKSALSMLEYAREHMPQVFVQFSTDEVYGSNSPDADIEEWGTILPSNPYAGSKAAQEAIAISYWRTYNLPVVITNTNNIIGPGQDVEKFVPKIVKAVLRGEEVTIHSCQGVIGSRCYNPVDNVADALRFILCLSVAKEGRPDRYNLGGGVSLDNLELAQLIAKVLDYPLLYRTMEVEGIRPGYDKSYARAHGRLNKLGWSPPVSFDEGLAAAVESDRRRFSSAN